MTIEDALRVIDTILAEKRLNNVQELLFRQAWEGKTYAEIAEKSGYDASYVRDVGYKLWQSLSQQIGERVTKSNVQVVFRRHAARLLPVDLISAVAITEPKQSRIDWGNAIAPTRFLGRELELENLKAKALDPNCHLIGIFGMGGVGKTALAIKLVEQLQKNFDLICWRSLRNAPPLVDLLTDLIQFLTNEPLPLHLLPSLQDNRETRRYRQGQLLSTLLQLLQECPCLIVLDGIEAILRPRATAGEYLEHYEGYGELFQQVAESRHRSSILITSREQPQSLIPWETDSKICGWHLQGLGAQAIALLPETSVAAEIADHYSGNPLALKIAVSGIQELFDGDLQAFWQERATIFGGIRQLLSQHSDRLSGIEAQVIIWLALRQLPMSVTDLQEVTTTSKSQLLEALSSLLRRSLAHRSNIGFTISPMMRAYINEQLAEQLCSDLIAGVSSTLCQYAITPTMSGSEQSFPEILLVKLLSYFGSRHSLNEMLLSLHGQLRQSNQVGYGIENLKYLQSMLTTNTNSLKCIEFPPAYLKRSDTFNFHARA
ncbi:MAG: NB-ARC domain-containing protein [Pseudanabaenaceae cyanobacterium bins.68]|nr:NB-ARC domain-containing protein [Pseudanabaenaceae cyanobacterium bins.68]